MNNTDYKEKNEYIRKRLAEMPDEEQDLILDSVMRLENGIKNRPPRRYPFGTAMALEVLYEIGRLMKKKEY
jgi:hypothetical protein